MTVRSDIEANKAAELIADAGIQWFRQNRSVAAMEAGYEPIVGYDVPRDGFICYSQPLVGPAVKFAHAVMRPGIPRFANAGARLLPFELPAKGALKAMAPPDGQWTISAFSDHSSDKNDLLAPYLTESTLVHEATHVIDGRRGCRHRPGFNESDRADLANLYYSTPHEYNAYFHQGLFAFLRDLPLVAANLRHRAVRAGPGGERACVRSGLLQTLARGSYWDIHFYFGLNAAYRRKFLRRFFRLCLALGLFEAAASAPDGSPEPTSVLLETA